MQHLKRLLEQQGWTQSQLADLLGRNRSAVTHLLQGSRQLKADEVVKIAHAFNVSFAEVLGEEATSVAVTKTPLAQATTPPVEKILTKEVVVEKPVPVEASIQFHIPPSTKLERHPAIRKQGQHYVFRLSQPANGTQYCIEVTGREVDHLGIIPHDIAFIGPGYQEGDLVLVEHQSQQDWRHELRLYQPPYLKSFSSLEGQFHALHEERATVRILGAVYAVTRMYRG